MTVFFCENLYCVIQALQSLNSVLGERSLCAGLVPEEGLLVWLLLLGLEFFYFLFMFILQH